MQLTYFNEIKPERIKTNSPLLEWRTNTHSKIGQCYTMTISKNSTSKGIRRLKIKVKANTYLAVYIHQDGSLLNEIPGSSKYIQWDNKIYGYEIEHEILDLLDYEGIPCNGTNDYKLTTCRFNLIHQVKFWVKSKFLKKKL